VQKNHEQFQCASVRLFSFRAAVSGTFLVHIWYGGPFASIRFAWSSPPSIVQRLKIGGSMMPKFVSLRSDNTSEIIHVNMDKVLMMAGFEAYTNLTLIDNSARKNITVRETPTEIMELIRRERED
jgi:hypothetical protein